MTHWTLKCERCDVRATADAAVWRCPACGGPFRWDVERRFDRSMIDRDASGLWRYARSLPLPLGDSISLGEVTTPLVTVDLGGVPVACKLDYLSPTGSYKDRGAAVLVSALRALGATHAVEDSSGNAAAAISAYAAAAGLACTVFAPAAASPGKLVQAEVSGATVVRVEGSRDAVAIAAVRAAAEIPGATYASHNWHPFFIDGVKTWAFEVWEQLGFTAPDAVVAPVGSGSMLLGAALAFGALKAAGEIARVPRLYAAQPAACAPVARAIVDGLDQPEPFERMPTVAEGTAIADPVRGRELLTAIRGSGGGAVAVEEERIVAAVRWMARRGIFIEPTSAVAVAGAEELVARGALREGEQIVIVLSGTGLKATDAIRRMLEPAG